MPHRRNSFVPNNNPLATPRRSPRLLQKNQNSTVPPTPTPFNSKFPRLNDSSVKPSNRKKSTESCAVPSRRSPRLANRQEKVPAIRQNDEEPSKYDSSAIGPRRPAKSKRGDGIGASKEAKEDPAGNCGVAVEEVAVVEVKKRNGKENKGGEKGKRKRKRCSGGKGIAAAEGWTKEQELALQKAYISVKPSPHFWKHVSKLVPGKSQQDCFDRVHGDHITPPQPKPRSRAKTISSPIQKFSISASKLLKPFEKKVTRPNILKQKNCIAQKLAEKMLQRHLQVDQDRTGDIFSVLEPNVEFPTSDIQPSVALSTPKQLKENQGLLQSCTDTSPSLSHKNSLSRFSGSRVTKLVSPPVLKEVKNKELHEKYVNQLRCREARRRANAARIRKIVGEGSGIQQRDAVKAAKAALVSEARDAINKFQQSQANFMDDTCCSDEDNNDEDIGVESE